MQAFEDPICAMSLLYFVWHKSSFERWLKVAGTVLNAPEPTQDIHGENGNAGSGGDTGERLLRAGFTVGEAVAPMTMATRLATFAMVPVKRAWMALKPVSNGEPCAIAATGTTRSKVRTAAAGRAHFNRRTGWMGRTR